MPRVPSMGDGPQFMDTSVDQPIQGQQVVTPGMAAIPGQQIQAMGQAEQNAGIKLTDIASQWQDEVNSVAAMNFRNNALRVAQSLAYDPNTGYQSLKGDAAITRPNGQTLPREYTGKLQEQLNDMMGKMASNPRQQLMMQNAANDIATQFQGDTERYTMDQFHGQQVSVNSAALDLAHQDSISHWQDAQRIDKNVIDAQTAVAQLGRAQGWSPTEVLAKQKAAVSTMYTGVIQAALDNRNPSAALAYFSQYKPALIDNDLLSTTKVMQGVLDGQTVQAGIRQTVQSLAPALNPTPMDNFVGVIRQMESGGKDDAVSPKGAKYAMQVMPDTAKNPGFGIQPAQNDSAAEYNRVGTQYLNAMLQKYGNPPQAMAAYNAGPGAVDDAIKQAGKAGQPQAWLNYLPKETQAYVVKGNQMLGANAGVQQFPTEIQFVNSALANLPTGAPIQQVTAMREMATQTYNMLDKSRKEQGDQALQAAQRAVVQAGGDLSQVPQSVINNLAWHDPDGVAKLYGYANTIQKGNTSSNPALITTLTADPGQMARISDTQWEQFRARLSPRDFEIFSKERGAILNGTTDLSPQSVNMKAISNATTNRIADLGLDPKKDRAKIENIQQFLFDAAITQQQQLGRKMTPDEINTLTDQTFAKNLTFQQSVLGLFSRAPSQQMLSMSAADIPESSKATVVADLAKSGINTPLDSQILRRYWLRKMQGTL